MSDLLTVTVDVTSLPATIAVAGELDPATAPLLRTEIARLAADGVDDVVFDLRALTFMDSTGLSEILRARSEPGSIVLRSPSGAVRRLLDVTGLIDHITIIN